MHCPVQQCNQAVALQHPPWPWPLLQCTAVCPHGERSHLANKDKPRNSVSFSLSAANHTSGRKVGRWRLSVPDTVGAIHPPLQLSRKHPVRNAFCTGTFLEIINCKRWRLVLLGACDSSWVFRDVLARRVRWSELIRRKAPCHRGSSLKSIRAAPSSGKRYFSCNKNLFPLFICLKKKTLFFSFLIFLLLFFCFLICFSFFSFFQTEEFKFSRC